MEGYIVTVKDKLGRVVGRSWHRQMDWALKEAEHQAKKHHCSFHSHSEAKIEIMGAWNDDVIPYTSEIR